MGIGIIKVEQGKALIKSHVLTGKVQVSFTGGWVIPVIHKAELMDMTVKTIAFDSANYYDILAQRPDWGPYFALGKDVIVVEGTVAYRVAEGDHPAVTVPAAPDPPAARPSAPPDPPRKNPLEQVRDWLLALWPW